MGLAQVLEQSTADARAIKEYICRQRPHNMKQLITWYRGNDVVALAVMLDGPREYALETAGMGTYGFGADTVSMVADSYVTPHEVAMPAPKEAGAADVMRAMSEEEIAKRFLHPITGKPMQYGDMTKLAEEEGGLEKGWVVEALSVSAVNRAGYQQIKLTEFRYAGKTLVWGKERLLVDDGPGTDTDVARGEIAETLVKQMNMPTLQQVQVSKGLNLTLTQRDVLTRNLIHARKLPARVVLLTPGADVVRVLRENNLLSGW